MLGESADGDELLDSEAFWCTVVVVDDRAVKELQIPAFMSC
jgi:hypothetical protein